jgi:SPP1 family predicted phage head-tail adaptor
MRAGILRKRVTFQSRDAGIDSFGGLKQTWSDICTCWAEIHSLTGNQLMAAEAVQSFVSHEITVRFQPALATPLATASMRAIYKGRFFNISSAPNVDEGNQYMIIQCKEGLNDG